MYDEQNSIDYQIDDIESEDSELNSLSNTTLNKLSNLKKWVDNGKPWKFEFLRDSTDWNYLIYSYVVVNWWTPEDIKSEVIMAWLVKQGTEIQVTEANAHPYDVSKQFFWWEMVYIRIRKPKKDSEWDSQKTKASHSEIVENAEQSEESPYKWMIERQTATEKIRRWDPDKPELSLTIDDGNNHANVEAILNILKEENVKSTFFIKWDRLKQNQDLRKRAIDEWHQICCHTYSHYYLDRKTDITNLVTWKNKAEHTDVNDWVWNVKRLLWTDYYDNVLKKDPWSNVPTTIRSDLLLETEILMWEEEIKNTLWEDYLKKCKKDHPFIRLPWWNGLEREKNIAVLKRLWYLSIYWSDDFLNKTDSSGKRIHDSIDEMKVQNWWIPLFHFNWKTEQNYIRDYIKKVKESGKSLKPLTDILTPTS